MALQELTATSEQMPLRGFMMGFLGIILSTGLLIASLWQLEIVSAFPGDVFDFPFYLWRVNKWWARDFWYLVNVVSWLLAVLSTAALVRTHHRR
jgi:hypothetical protein